MYSRILGLAIAITLLPRLALGQDSTSRACFDTAMTQAAMTRCAGADLQNSRARLQRLVQELRATLDSAARPGLDSVQRRWDAYSKAQCRWEGAAYDGGSMRPMIESGCLAQLTQERIAVLKQFLCGWDNQRPNCEAAKRYDISPREDHW